MIAQQDHEHLWIDLFGVGDAKFNILEQIGCLGHTVELLVQ